MEFVHRIGIGRIEYYRLKNQFDSLGIAVREPDKLVGGTVMVISENHRHWQDICELLRENGISPAGILDAKFSKEDFESASHFMVRALPKYYPCPQENHCYRSVTYDLRDFCPSCGIGLKQKEQFQVDRKGKLNPAQIIMLNWIDDEVFLMSELWERVFKPFGISQQKVKNCKGTRSLDDLVQVVVPAREVKVVTEGLTVLTCECCSRAKIEWPKGYFPRLADRDDYPMAKTTQYFGSGTTAAKPIIIDRALYSALTRTHVKSLILTPLASRGSHKS